MKTIAIDLRLVGKGRTGDEAVFTNLTREMLAADRDNRYILLTDTGEPQRLAALTQIVGALGRENVSVVALPARNRFLWNALILPFWLIRNRPDVFHTQYILPLFVARSIRVVLHIHDVSFAAHPEFIGASDRLFLRLFIPRSLSRADAIVVPSAFTRSEVIRYFRISGAKIAIVPNAAAEAFDNPPDGERTTQLRERFGLQDHPYLVAVGTFQPRKNIPFLIEAFAGVRARIPDVRLVLIGNRKAHHIDGAIDRTIARFGLSDAVVFPGYLADADLRALVAGAAGSAFPSLYEGFGIPLLEAMLLRVPVACSDLPVFHEVAGDCVRYFDPRNVASASETLYNLLIAFPEREGLVTRARERAGRFSWKKSAAILRGIYLQ